MNPFISVILPVYNAELYLKEAIDSILNQTFGDFELLIYNDGSSDQSDAIITSYSDPRIVHTIYEQNIGLIQVLNNGLSESKGKYIARMDADDISLPNRFEEQLKFLEKHPDHGICGTQVKLIGSEGMLNKPCEDESLRWWIFKGSPLAHPSIMLRTSVIRDCNLSFNHEAYVVEDFELWWRMAFHTKMANLNQVLLHYRIHDQQVSSAKKEIQYANFRASQTDFIKTLGINSLMYSAEYINNLLSRNLKNEPVDFKILWNFFEDLAGSEQAVRFFGIQSIRKQQTVQAMFMLQNMKKFNAGFLQYLSSDVFKGILKAAGISRCAFVMKSLLQWKTR